MPRARKCHQVHSCSRMHRAHSTAALLLRGSMHSGLGGAPLSGVECAVDARAVGSSSDWLVRHLTVPLAFPRVVGSVPLRLQQSSTASQPRRQIGGPRGRTAHSAHGRGSTEHAHPTEATTESHKTPRPCFFDCRGSKKTPLALAQSRPLGFFWGGCRLLVRSQGEQRWRVCVFLSRCCLPSSLAVQSSNRRCVSHCAAARVPANGRQGRRRRGVRLQHPARIG
jgi:hypothetical protein